MTDYKITDVFSRVDCKPDTRLIRIDTHTKGKNGKPAKLANSIYSFEYVGTDRPIITMYKTDLNKLIYLERWSLKTI